jgi:peptidoglycan/xylan/chitin deacetylase (PgdA/CDA1 family)
VAATFFMTGRWAELYPQWARPIAARYPIGNHTFDHSDLTFLTHIVVRREILMARTAIRQVTGRPPAPFFRFPYGASSSETLSIANQLGYTAVGWTVDTLGWEGATAGQSVGSVIDHALGALSPGEIILMHVGSNPQRRLDARRRRARHDHPRHSRPRVHLRRASRLPGAEGRDVAMTERQHSAPIAHSPCAPARSRSDPGADAVVDVGGAP